MDFLKMKFCTLFLEKHGEKIFNKICNIIKQENREKFSEKYVEIIFKVSFLSFCGVEEKSIRQMLSDNTNIKYPLNIETLTKTHKKSIAEIQKYLKKSMDETINDINK